MSESRFWFVLFPDIKKPIGGVKQIHRLCETITKLGFYAAIVQEDSTFHPGWFASHVTTVSRKDWLALTLSPQTDYVVTPETFITQLFGFGHPTLPRIIYNQNASYTFGLKQAQFFDPSLVIKQYFNPLVRHVLCVSRFDQEFLVSGLRLPEQRITFVPNYIDFKIPDISSSHKKKQIAFMPRKNFKDSSIVVSLLRNHPCFSGWSLVPIHNKSHQETIQILSESLVFLSFGHPEGFGLPVAEAMACKCFVIGYTGLGGNELFGLSSLFNTSRIVSLGDWTSFLTAFGELNSIIQYDSDFLHKSLELCSQSILINYSADRTRLAVSSFLSAVSS